jgi:hypothetical protein
MHRPRRSAIISFALVVILGCVPCALADTHLQYRNRGNRYEGVKPRPVSGYDIELISARVDYKEEVMQMPDRLKVSFYLERPSQVHLIVRELDYKYYYWLDKVQPLKPWRPGLSNVFEWSTRDVIQQLDMLEMYDLGIVARLERPEPSKAERVAPVILYHSQLPSTRNAYLFTFKTSGDVRLTCSIYKEGGSESLFTHVFRRQRGGRSFTVRWQTAAAVEGFYKLVVRGYFLDSNDPIEQTVSFYHQPVVK